MKKLILTLAILLSSSSFASMAIKGNFARTYPDFKGLSCKVCHTTVPQLNPYGMDAQKAKLDFKSIESIDSDGDTFSNGDEIKASTNPGDKNSASATIQ